MNTFFWVLIIVGSLFLLSNLGKVKASKKQMNRDNRINRFGRRQKKPQGRPTIIEGEAEEIIDGCNQGGACGPIFAPTCGSQEPQHKGEASSGRQ